MVLCALPEAKVTQRNIFRRASAFLGAAPSASLDSSIGGQIAVSALSMACCRYSELNEVERFCPFDFDYSRG
jgi:hypothetical protein